MKEGSIKQGSEGLVALRLLFTIPSNFQLNTLSRSLDISDTSFWQLARTLCVLLCSEFFSKLMGGYVILTGIVIWAYCFEQDIYFKILIKSFRREGN